MKLLVYLMNVLGLAPYFLDERRRIRKFGPSTLLSTYSSMIILIFLCNRLAMIVGNIFNDNMENVYTFAAIMKRSPYNISHSCFLFYTLLLLGQVVNFLHVLLSFNTSIYFTFTAFDNKFNYVKVQISVLVPLHTLMAFQIFSDLKGRITLTYCFVSLWLYQLCQ